MQQAIQQLRTPLKQAEFLVSGELSKLRRKYPLNLVLHPRQWAGVACQTAGDLELSVRNQRVVEERESLIPEVVLLLQPPRDDVLVGPRLGSQLGATEEASATRQVAARER